MFAFTQVATLFTDDPTFAGIGRGVLVLAALWWTWSAYAWLTNTVDPEEGVVGVALLVALIGMFVAALVVPGVFDDEGVPSAPPSSSSGRCTRRSTPSRAAEPRTARRRARLAPWTMLGATLILVAGFTDGARIWLCSPRSRCAYVGGGEWRDGLASAPVAFPRNATALW